MYANSCCNSEDDMDYTSNIGDNIGFVVDNELDYYKELKPNLYDWISSIDYSKAIRIKNYDILMDANSCFLSFNYTLTLEKLYLIDSSNICHIHGVITDIYDSLIMGHGKVDDYTMDFELVKGKDKWKYEEPRYIEARISIKKYLGHTRKPVQKLIKIYNDFFTNNCNNDEIYILGFSFEDVDLPYIKRVLNDSPCAKVFVSYYKDEEKKAIW